MIIIVERKYKYPTSILGELSINGSFFVYTLEDVYREEKVYGETCIDAGIYKIIVTHSNRFKRPLPLLLNVPKFSGIRIHGGNTDKNTNGCILIGSDIDLKRGTISNCSSVVDSITKQIAKEEATIQIIDKTF